MKLKLPLDIIKDQIRRHYSQLGYYQESLEQILGDDCAFNQLFKDLFMVVLFQLKNGDQTDNGDKSKFVYYYLNVF